GRQPAQRARTCRVQPAEERLMRPRDDSIPPRPLDSDPEPLERVRTAIDEIRAGKMVILVDDEDRENEGDLCMAAETVTPEAINFMAKFGRGFIFLNAH